ncbi:hypothetical protein GCM10023336_00840 [Streptomyces similanensis]|uniref:Uncharacterized protein n=1 Tax=Streptomyces similanensis TaxID=1274988 RepID=A0ABP9JRV7_9ACTN
MGEPDGDGPPRRVRHGDHLGQGLARHTDGRRTGVQAVHPLRHRRIVQVHDPEPARRQRVRYAAGAADDEFRPAVGEQTGGLLGRQFRVDRQTGGAGLPHRQRRHDRVGVPRRAQTDHGFRAHALSGQVPRQPVGPRVQLGEGHPVAVGAAGAADGRVRRPRRPRLEQLHHRRRGRRAGRGVVPVGEDARPLPRRQDVDPADRVARLGPGEAAQDAQEARADLLLRLQVARAAVHVDVDLEAGAVQPVVDVDAERVDGAVGEVAGRARAVAEAEPVVERHDVDDQVAQRGAAEELEVAEHVLVPVALVPGRGAHPCRDLPQEVRHRRRPADGDPDRQDVRRHAGNREGPASDAAHHRDADDDVPRARGAVVVEAGGGDGQAGQGGPQPARAPLEAGGLVGADLAPVPYRRLRQRTRPVPVGAPRAGGVRQRVEPVLPVLGQGGGGPVGAVLVQEHRDRLQGVVLPGVAAFREGRVDARQPVGEQPAAVSVHDEVVRAVQPVVPVRAGLDHGVAGQGAAGEVHRAAQSGPHPRLGGRVRVGFGGEVHEFDGMLVRVAQVLPRNVVLDAEAQPGRLGLVHRVAQGSYEEAGVEVAAYLHVFGDVVDRVLGVELLCVPDSELAGHEFLVFAFRCSHPCTPQPIRLIDWSSGEQQPSRHAELPSSPQ